MDLFVIMFIYLFVVLNILVTSDRCLVTPICLVTCYQKYHGEQTFFNVFVRNKGGDIQKS